MMRFLLLCLLAVGLASGQTPAPEPRLDVNRASSADFDAIPGVGPVTAELIVGAREQLGGFRNFAEVHAVPKLSRRIVELIRARMDLVPRPDTAQPAGVARKDSK
jgi:DNA uptake protein ComE-like DNA-binding protein